MKGGGPLGDVVLSSRVRLARNLADTPFPPQMTPDLAERTKERVARAFEGWRDREGRPLRLIEIARLSPLDRQVMVEKHLTSPLHVRQEAGALLLSADEATSIMINEEDHVRFQCLAPGLDLAPALERALRLDQYGEECLPWAYDEDWGYLATCPTNVGTGLRASVMAHLPAIALSNQLQGILLALSNAGLTARGLYGEGSEAHGHLFQISNARTLGRSEGEIVQQMESAVRQVVERERSLRELMASQMGDQLADRVWRAYGILANARSISSAEAMELLSLLRLGVDLHIVPQVDPGIFNELIVLTRPGFLQRLLGGAQSPEKRDTKRASLIRAALARATG
ncbi:MAG: protein arginine kinase [Clostridia bacterium]|nr:protein arginine kinase [Clostridia bacterium]